MSVRLSLADSLNPQGRGEIRGNVGLIVTPMSFQVRLRHVLWSPEIPRSATLMLP